MSCNNVNCNYSEWVKTPCLDNKLIKIRTINTSAQGTNGTSCNTNQNNYIDTETCILPNNCELSNWSDWSPCSSGKQIKTRQVKNPPKIGGDVCPESLTVYFETQNCTANNTTTDNCTYTNWSDWSPCTTVKGIGYQVRTRGVLTVGGNCSNNYVDYVQKKTCNDNPINDCILSDWSWSPCSTKCGNGFKIGTRTILENAKNDGKLCPMDISSYYIRENCTSNEYCPVDCITTDWGACINNVSTRTVTPAQNCGTCPSGTDVSRPCNNCTVSDWGACNGTKQTRTFQEATNGGTFCTADQKVTERPCNNCTVSDWSACNGTKQTRTFQEATNGGTFCTADQKVTEQSCNNCTVSDWSACNGTKQTRTFQEATNGGTFCTADQKVTERPCNNCIVDGWGACNGTKQTRTVREATNGGTFCTADQRVTERPCNNCIVGSWNACNNTTGKQTRTVTQATNGGIACTAEQNITEQSCDRITVYTDSNYGGNSAGFPVGNHDIGIIASKIGNDVISSIKVDSGYKATIYRDGGYSGGSQILTANQPNLSNISFDNTISSIKVVRV